MKYLLALVLGLATLNAYAIPVTLGDITGNPAHVETDTGDELFRLTDTSGVLDDATAFLLFEFAGYANINTLGIYGSDGTTLEIFDGASSAVTSATLSWNIFTDVVTNLSTGAVATVDNQLFGFYLESGDGGTYFSETAKNGGLDMMMLFDVGAAGHPDLFGSNLVLAWEDVAGGDQDYNDMVVGVSDISPSDRHIEQVPEPGSLAMLGFGLVGVGAYTRRRKFVL